MVFLSTFSVPSPYQLPSNSYITPFQHDISNKSSINFIFAQCIAMIKTKVLDTVYGIFNLGVNKLYLKRLMP